MDVNGCQWQEEKDIKKVSMRSHPIYIMQGCLTQEPHELLYNRCLPHHRIAQRAVACEVLLRSNAIKRLMMRTCRIVTTMADSTIADSTMVLLRGWHGAAFAGARPRGQRARQGKRRAGRVVGLPARHRQDRWRRNARNRYGLT